jgi:tetratricopeptide (TPR) repeat protein
MPGTATTESADGNSEHGAPIERPISRLVLVEAMLDAALVALRNATLGELIRQRPYAVRYLTRRFAKVVRGSVGDALDVLTADVRIATTLLRWLITQLRPDGEASLDGIGQDAWLNLTSWRPMLAVACHAGVLRVPDFRERYRRRADEAVLENLCGLWNVGPSTFYRYQERGKRAMAQTLLESPTSVARVLSLRSFALRELHGNPEQDPAQRHQWHRAQIGSALLRRDPSAALWHAWQGADSQSFARVLRAHATALAGEPETDALALRIAATPLSTRKQFDLWLARAALARTRDAPERELSCYDEALAIAQACDDRLLKGIVYGALGKFHEPRDADRAFACYQDSAEFLIDFDPAGGDALATEHHLTTLVRLAWLYVLRNDTRGKAVLERAEAMRNASHVPEDVLGMLEQSWGEYWRRAGELPRSLEHRQRALNIFERVGDERSVLTTSLNLTQTYAELKQFDKAIHHAERVLDAASRATVEPAIVVSAHLNLGATHFLQGHLEAAIDHYRLALLRSAETGLRLHAFRARYNLAEAHYRRFRDKGDPDDERLGDRYVGEALASPASDSSPAALDAARRLKDEILAAQAEAEPDRLQPPESGVHFDEMAEVQRYREVLSVPGSPVEHVQAHLAIANAYLQVSVKERESARELIERHGLHERFTEELARLHATFDRQFTREQRVWTSWRQQTSDLFDDARRAALVERLLRDGSINKSAYADLCGVSPATASKHLTLLAERGLLQQTGKGPSTRYLLPG